MKIDCRAMDNPERDRDLQDHMGYHPDILKDAIKSPSAKGWTRRVVRLVEQDSRGRINIVVLCCTSGRHRARALENLLQGGLNLAGCKVPHVQSLSECYWKNKGCRFDTCPKCCQQPPEDDKDIEDCYATVYSWMLKDDCKLKPSN